MLPRFPGSDAEGKTVRLSDVRGRAAVVYFYPKDDTPGCTKEACGFRDAFQKYTTRGIAIFGVSRDSADSHQAFRGKYALPFVLVADVDGNVQRAYGVASFMGVPSAMASRVTFLVGKDGTIARVFPQVDPGVHATEVLDAVDAVAP